MLVKIVVKSITNGFKNVGPVGMFAPYVFSSLLTIRSVDSSLLHVGLVVLTYSSFGFFISYFVCNQFVWHRKVLGPFKLLPNLLQRLLWVHLIFNRVLLALLSIPALVIFHKYSARVSGYDSFYMVLANAICIVYWYPYLYLFLSSKNRLVIGLIEKDSRHTRVIDVLRLLCVNVLLAIATHLFKHALLLYLFILAGANFLLFAKRQTMYQAVLLSLRGIHIFE